MSWPPDCLARHEGRDGRILRCLLPGGHHAAHEDLYGDLWDPIKDEIAELTERWGATHTIHQVANGRWVTAVHRDPAAPWRTEVESSPAKLEARLRGLYGDPPGPRVTNPPTTDRNSP